MSGHVHGCGTASVVDPPTHSSWTGSPVGCSVTTALVGDTLDGDTVVGDASCVGASVTSSVMGSGTVVGLAGWLVGLAGWLVGLAGWLVGLAGWLVGATVVGATKHSASASTQQSPKKSQARSQLHGLRMSKLPQPRQAHVSHTMLVVGEAVDCERVVGLTVEGEWEVALGATVVGLAVVGEAEGGTLDGETDDGDAVIGDAVVGLAVVGLAVVGLAEVGLTELGLTELGLTELGLTVVGLAVVVVS